MYLIFFKSSLEITVNLFVISNFTFLIFPRNVDRCLKNKLTFLKNVEEMFAFQVSGGSLRCVYFRKSPPLDLN